MPTKTIKSAGGDYTTVALWEADTDNDLAGTGENIGEIYDVNTTAAITIAGATNTDATNFRHLTVNSAHRHAGVWDTGKSNFQVSNGASGVINVDEAFSRLSYIQAKNTHATAGSAAYRINSVSGVQIAQCIGWATAASGGDDCAGVYVNGAGATNYVIRNSVFYAMRRGIYVNNASATGGVIQNCATVGNNVDGIRSAATLTLTNCYSGGNAGDDYNEAGVAGWSTWTATTNMCEDSITETGLTSGVAWSTANFTNVTAGSIDIHLVTGSALIDAGTDLSGSFTVDIDGVARSGTWDVGADEFVAAAGGRFVNRQIILGVG
jgi:hypothetical protein